MAEQIIDKIPTACVDAFLRKAKTLSPEQQEKLANKLEQLRQEQNPAGMTDAEFTAMARAGFDLIKQWGRD